jgi:hypothetical protein
MKKTILVAGLAFSTMAISTEAVNVNALLTNPDQLDMEILKVEQIPALKLSEVQKNKIEKLKFNLIELKRLGKGLSNEGAMNEALKFSNNHQWTNTSAFLYKAKEACQSAVNLENECFIKLAEFDEFVKNRQMPEDSKVHLKNLVKDYSQFKEAGMVINGAFLRTTNALLEDSQDLITSSIRPLATIKIAPAAEVKKPIVVAPKIPEKSLISFEEFSKYSDFLMWGLGSVLLVALAVKGIFVKKEKNRIKRFYSDILYVTQKHKIPTKFYGKIKRVNTAKLKKIDTLYIDLLNSSGVLKTNLDVRLKNRDKKLIIETVVYSKNPIQDVVLENSFVKFTEQLHLVEKEMIKLGGELHVTNAFDQQGKFASSSFVVIL